MLFIGNIAGKNGGVDSFCMASVKAAKKIGLSYHLAANFSQTPFEKLQEDEIQYGVSIHHIDFARNPLHQQNIRAYKQLVKLIQDEKIDYIHCNTPVGGLLGRLAGKRCKVKKIIYQVHGFHFYKGAPKLNWMLYYPIERWLAHCTDALITINNEDYKLAKNKFKLSNAGKVYYVPGVGIDLNKYTNNELSLADRKQMRESLGISAEDKVLISVGELNKNKNHEVIIQALAKLGDKTVHYIIAGKGKLYDYLENLAKDLGVSRQIHLLGFRTDVADLYRVSDICVFPSIREGLGLAAIEGMASGLPLICADNAGTKDYAIDGKNAFVCNFNDVDEFLRAIETLVSDLNMRNSMGALNCDISKKFDVNTVIKEMYKIYNDIIQ